MKASKTQEIGTRTKTTRRISRVDVANKDPNFDYCFRSRKDIEEGGGIDNHGWEVIGANNSNGECTQVPGLKTRGKKQVAFSDVVLCKRSKEITSYYKDLEDEKYNAQKELIRTAAPRAQARLRELDPNARVVDGSSGVDYDQRTGPTE
jgi:hypothetical protein